MKVALLGPICKDHTKIDKKTNLLIGGIVYYAGVTLKNLGADVTVYGTFNSKDKAWIQKHFKGINLKHIPDKNTLNVYMEYSSSNPDVRVSRVEKPHKGFINPSKKLIKELEQFDWIILAPLAHTNITLELVKKLKGKNLVSDNFGFYTAVEKGKVVCKYPEKLIRVLPYLKYLFLDFNEAALVSQKKELKDMASFFLKKGLENLIITEGSKGSHVFMNGAYFKIPAFAPSAIIDPTGAGDSYMAGFIKALTIFDEIEKRGRFAAMVATIDLETRGAFHSTTEEVISRLKKYGVSI
jgi:sugar/nucleoside kinase (ribokinase family)